LSRQKTSGTHQSAAFIYLNRTQAPWPVRFVVPLIDGKYREVLADVLPHRRHLCVLDACQRHQREAPEIVKILALEQIFRESFFCGSIEGLGR
jgi:hypothetical protein